MFYVAQPALKLSNRAIKRPDNGATNRTEQNFRTPRETGHPVLLGRHHRAQQLDCLRAVVRKKTLDDRP